MIDLGPLTNILGSQLYFGNTLIQYVAFLITIIVFVVIAKVVYYIFKHHVSKLTAKTETKIDDIIVGLIQKPLLGGLFIVGLFIGMQFLSLAAEVQAGSSNIV